jgi:methylglyoxal reductase
MQMRKLGTTNIEASVVSLGTWAIGGGPWWGPSDNRRSIQAIHAAFDTGVTMIDTAPAYGLGRSEEIVGKALEGRRHNVVLATKCGIWWHDIRGEFVFEVEGHKAYKTLAPETIRKEIAMSLQRLKTDYIDLYQTHWPVIEPGKYAIGDTMECLLKLKDEGKIRAIGASNVSIEQIQEYLSVGVLDAVQPKYSILDRKIEQQLLPFCINHAISTLAYSPLEQGILTGKFGLDYVLDEESTRNNIPWFRPQNRQNVLDMLARWNDLTEKYDCTLGQLVIAWTIAQPGITYALCGARKPEHAIANARAGDIMLSHEDRERMRNDVVLLGEPLE